MLLVGIEKIRGYTTEVEGSEIYGNERGNMDTET